MEDSNHESDDRSRGTLATIASALVPSFIQRRYALKFLVSILIVVIVISSVGAYGFLQAEGAVRTSTENQLTETSELRADSLNEWLEKMNLQTRTVSAGKPLQQNEQQAAYLVTEQERMSDDVLAVHLIDTGEGTVKTSTEFPLEGIALSDLEERDVPWANADVPSGAGENDKVWMSSRSYRSPVMDDKPVIAFASSVPDQPNQYVVVIARVQGHLDRIQNSETNQETQIINTNGETVLQIDQEVDADVHESHINDTRQNGSVLFQKTDQEAHAYAYVEKSDWVAITTVDNEHAFAVRDTVAQNVGLIIVSALLTLCLVGFVLGRQTVVPLTALRERAQRMEEGDLDVDLQTHRTDEIGRLYDGFDSMRNSLRNQIQAAEDAREEAEAARAETESMNRHLEAKAEEFSAVMDECADGDLTRRLDPESESDAMSDIAVAFNEMVEELEGTTADVKSFANEVAAASEQVTASSEEVRSASQQVSESIQSISDGADQQNQNLQSVNQEMSSLSTTTEEIAASSNNVADIAERTAETGRLGREAAQEAIDGMHEIEAESMEAVDAIEELEREMEQVDELVEFISEVARETNMLALNANIEASRGASGEDGTGFGAVAEQVKELAADTKSTAEDIEQRLERVNEQTSETTIEVQRTADRIAEHVDSVENAAEALDEIADYAEQTNDGVQEISAATEEQAASTQEVVAMVSTATDISESTAAESQRVAAAAEEQTSALSEVSESASSLADQAAHLSETLDHFETEARDDADDDADEGTLEQTDESAVVEFGDDGDEQGDADASASDAETVDEESTDNGFTFSQFDDE